MTLTVSSGRFPVDKMWEGACGERPGQEGCDELYFRFGLACCALKLYASPCGSGAQMQQPDRGATSSPHAIDGVLHL